MWGNGAGAALRLQGSARGGKEVKRALSSGKDCGDGGGRSSQGSFVERRAQG